MTTVEALLRNGTRGTLVLIPQERLEAQREGRLH
jgi:hypothetical protein